MLYHLKFQRKDRLLLLWINLSTILTEEFKKKKKKGLWSSCCGSAETVWLASMRMQVWSLALFSGLKIWCCHELWCRFADSAWIWHCCGCGCRPVATALTPSLGTSICCGCGPKKTKKKKKKRGRKRERSLVPEAVEILNDRQTSLYRASLQTGRFVATLPQASLLGPFF